VVFCNFRLWRTFQK